MAEADRHTLLDLLADLVAPAIKLRPGRADRVVDAICEAGSLDMSKYWSATVEAFFEHVRKDVIVDAIKELNAALDRSKLDKAPKKELLTRAKKAFRGSTWMPEPLRAHSSASAPVEAIAAD